MTDPAADVLKATEGTRKHTRSLVKSNGISLGVVVAADTAASLVHDPRNWFEWLFLVVIVVMTIGVFRKVTSLGRRIHPANWIVGTAVFVTNVVLYGLLHGDAQEWSTTGVWLGGLVVMYLVSRLESRRILAAAS